MKRFTAILVLLFLSILYCVNAQNITLYSIAKSCDENVELCDDEGDFQVVEISNEKIDQLISDINLQIINRFEIEDRIIIEGYTDVLKDYTLINNIKINIQISIGEDFCLVGYPLIKNSF